MTRSGAWVLLAAVLWGTTGTAAAMAPDVGPLAVGAAATGVGGLLQALVGARAIGAHRAALWNGRCLVGFSALAAAVFPLAFYTSMRWAGVAVGTIVTIGSAPLISALVERVVDGRRLSGRWLIAAGFGVVGVVLLAGARTDEISGVAVHPVAGIALGLVAGGAYAWYSWGAGRLMGELPVRAVMGSVAGLGGMLLMPVLLVTGAPILAGAENFAAVAYLAVVPMFLGYLAFGRGLAALPASTVTTLTLTESAVAALCAVVVLGERLAAAGWVGMGLVSVSLALTVRASSADLEDHLALGGAVLQ